MDLCKKFVNSGLHKRNNYYNAVKYLFIVLPELYDACGVKIYYKIVIYYKMTGVGFEPTRGISPCRLELHTLERSANLPLFR